MKIALNFLHLVAPQVFAMHNRLVKLLAVLALVGAASLGFSACQNHPSNSQADFQQKTHRTFNPETGSFEQSPPYGKQSNKSDSN
jgi:predicted component of type VI protein secretion system